MHDAPHQFVRAPAQHAFRRGIDEGGPAFRVDTVDALANGVQDQLVFPLQITEQFLDPSPFQQSAPVVAVRLVPLAQAAQLPAVPQQHQQGPGFRRTQPGRGDFHLDPVSVPVRQVEFPTPAPAP